MVSITSISTSEDIEAQNGLVRLPKATQLISGLTEIQLKFNKPSNPPSTQIPIKWEAFQINFLHRAPSPSWYF